MKTTSIATLVLSLAAFAGTQAFAMSTTPLTRDQVRAELAQAVRSGDIPALGEQSGKLNELHPQQYPVALAAPALTSAQVQAELAQAIRSGDIQVGGEQSSQLNELFPERYPVKSVAAISSATTAANEVSSYETFHGEGNWDLAN